MAALLSFRNNYLFNVKQYELYECTRFGRSDQFCVKCLRVCPCVGVPVSLHLYVCVLVCVGHMPVRRVQVLLQIVSEQTKH